MTSAEHSALVSRLIEVKRQLAEIEALKETLQNQLIEEAQRLLKADGEKTFVGCKYTFLAPDGALARVNFPRDQVIREFRFNDSGEAFRTKGSGKDAEITLLPGLRKYSGSQFDKLFTTHHKPAKAFEELCGALLGPVSKAQLIDLCTEPSSPRVTTEAAKTVNG